MKFFFFELACAFDPWYDPHTMSNNDAFDKGYQAFLDGQDVLDNPFQENSDEWEEWEAGWCAASDEDLDQ